MYSDLNLLRTKGAKASKNLETFENPGCCEVTYSTDEFTSNCPVTGAPDYYQVFVTVYGAKRLIESKSFKLYCWAYRGEGHFCEALAAIIAADVGSATGAHEVVCRVVQKPRGGVAIEAISNG